MRPRLRLLNSGGAREGALGGEVAALKAQIKRMSGKGKKKRDRPAAGAMAEDDDEEDEGDNEEVMSLALEVFEMSAKGRALPRRRSRRQSVRRGRRAAAAAARTPVESSSSGRKSSVKSRPLQSENPMSPLPALTLQVGDEGERPAWAPSAAAPSSPSNEEIAASHSESFVGNGIVAGGSLYAGVMEKSDVFKSLDMMGRRPRRMRPPPQRYRTYAPATRSGKPPRLLGDEGRHWSADEPPSAPFMKSEHGAPRLERDDLPFLAATTRGGADGRGGGALRSVRPLRRPAARAFRLKRGRTPKRLLMNASLPHNSPDRPSTLASISSEADPRWRVAARPPQVEPIQTLSRCRAGGGSASREAAWALPLRSLPRSRRRPR